MIRTVEQGTDIRNAAARAGQELIGALLGSLLIASAAQISIPLPWTPVPFTGQTLAVLFLALKMRGFRPFFAVGLYLLEGLAGFPVFAGGLAGAAVAFGPSAGYLLGFFAASLTCGFLASALAKLLLAETLIFGFGALWLSQLIGVEAALWAGVVAFVPGELVKISILLASVRSQRR